MGTMGAVEKFLVNRLKEWTNERTFRLMRDILGVARGAVCLEIGCGKGDMAYRIFRGFQPANYVATDYDPRQLDIAKDYLTRQFEGSIPSNLELRTSDALSLPFPEATFDVVFAFAILHHTEDKWWQFRRIPQALGEVARVLRPEGHFVYQEYVHKRRIRDRLEALGFRLRIRRTLLGISELVGAAREPTGNLLLHSPWARARGDGRGHGLGAKLWRNYPVDL